MAGLGKFVLAYVKLERKKVSSYKEGRITLTWNLYVYNPASESNPGSANSLARRDVWQMPQRKKRDTLSHISRLVYLR